ncbi:MAG: DUF6537 domain-containing protein, partial [Janthinobacterium lividum]
RRKIAVPGRIALPIFRLLQHGKMLRGTVIDPFGWQRERREEQALARRFEADVKTVLPLLSAKNLETAISLARLPLDIRGFGPVKATSIAEAEPKRRALLGMMLAPDLGGEPHATRR